MRLLPYLYAAYADYRYTGLPPARALVMDYPVGSPPRGRVDDQYMLVRSLMVAPLFAGQTAAVRLLAQGRLVRFLDAREVCRRPQHRDRRSRSSRFPSSSRRTLLPLAEPVECVTPIRR